MISLPSCTNIDYGLVNMLISPRNSKGETQVRVIIVLVGIYTGEGKEHRWFCLFVQSDLVNYVEVKQIKLDTKKIQHIYKVVLIPTLQASFW